MLENMFNKFYFLFCAIILFFTSCEFLTKKEPYVLTPSLVLQKDQAASLIKDKQFLQAAKIYKKLSQQIPKNSLKQAMLLNSGVAYQLAGHCKQALNSYKKLLASSLKIPFFRAKAHIETSFAYECLGDSKNSFVYLKRLESFLSVLSKMFYQIIYPARLTLVKAKLGQMYQAESFKNLSLERVIKFQKSIYLEKDLNERVSQVFYLMGRSYVKKSLLNPDSFLKSFFYHQLYLLQSLFLKDKTWSPRAKKELHELFDKLIFALSKKSYRLKYKKLIIQNIADGKLLIKKENSKKLKTFYFKKSQTILKILL